MAYKDRSRVLQFFGLLLLLAGGACAVLGPVEMYVFYLFSAGGPFYYEGFGFGSFMFGNVAAQIAGYYLIALLLIPLGYGHLRLRRWARPGAEALLRAWLVVGAPLLVIFLLILFSSKDLEQVAALVALILVALSYLVFPALLIRFYRGENVRQTFAARDSNVSWLEERPVAVLTVTLLFGFYALVLHAPIFFNGLFPLFGTWLTGLTGISVLTGAILLLALLTWGLWGQRAWAWWGALVYVCLLALTTFVTLLSSTFAEMLAAMNLPPTEMEILGGVPLQGWHLAIFVGLPMVLTVAALLATRWHFTGN